LAGIALWINNYYRLPEDRKVSKHDPLIAEIKKWIDSEYEKGRITVISDDEMEEQIRLHGGLFPGDKG
ncbi:MAG: hypothetical protein J6X60_07265, partial [Ruminiclostridium sp.]|nr:hypothetical protein [Ruminiclostridium sp.]